MKIQVKIHDSNGHVRTVDVPTGKKITTFITPEEGKFNYELVDLETGTGPQSIIAKRQGNDLAIAFEDADQADLIFENYYAEEEPSLIIGLAEDGSYYAYIPESGMGADAIPSLNEAVLASEVLGGEAIGVVPFAAFPHWYSVLGGAFLLGAAALASGTVGSTAKKLNISPAHKNSVDTPTVTNKDGAFEIKVPDTLKTGDKVNVAYTRPDGTKAETSLVKQADGSLKSGDETAAPSIPSGQNTTVIPAENVMRNSEVTAQTEDSEGNKSGVARDNNPPVIAPNVEFDNTKKVFSITLPPAQKGDKVVISFTKPSGEEENVVLTYQGNNSEPAWVSNKPSVINDVPKGVNVIEIPSTQVKTNTDVTATIEPISGEPLTDDARQVANKPAPEVETGPDGASIQLPADAMEGDQIRVWWKSNEGADREETLTKQADGSWLSSDPNNPKHLPDAPAGATQVTIQRGFLAPSQTVRVQFVGKDGEQSEIGEEILSPLPEQPSVSPDGTLTVPVSVLNGGGKVEVEVREKDKQPTTDNNTDTNNIKIKLPENVKAGTVVRISYTDNNGNPQTTDLTKQPEGSDPAWKSSDPNTIADVPAGVNEATLPKRLVQDGKESEVKAETITIVTLQEDEQGNIKSDNEEIVPSISNNEVNKAIEEGRNPTTNINRDKLVENSPIAASSTDKDGNKSASDTNNVVPNSELPLETPDVTATPKGDVKVTLPKNSPEVEISFVKEGETEKDQDGNPKQTTYVVSYNEQGERVVTEKDTGKPVEVKQDEDGNTILGEVSDNPNVNNTLPQDTKEVILPASLIADDTDVSAVSKDPQNNRVSETDIDKSHEPDTSIPDEPKVIAHDNGSVSVEVPTTNVEVGDQVVISVRETGKPEDSEVVLTLGANGEWHSSRPDIFNHIPQGSNVTTIAADKVEDNTTVSAYSTDPAGNKNPTIGSAVALAPAPDLLPSPPTVEALLNGDVKLTVPTDAQPGDKVEVTLTLKGEERKITLVRQDAKDDDKFGENPEDRESSGWKAFDEAGKESEAIIPNVKEGNAFVIIPGANVDDDTLVTAKTINTQGKESVPHSDRSKEDDSTAPTAPILDAPRDGTLIITLPQDAKAGDEVVISVVETGKETPTPIIFTKQPDGSWISNNEALAPSVPKGENSSVIPADKLEDDSLATGLSRDPAGNQSEPATPARIKEKPSEITQPTVEDNKLVVDLPETAKVGDKVRVAYTDKQQGNPKEVIVTKTDDGWSSPDENITFDGDKAVVFDADPAKGGMATLIVVPDAPEVTTKPNGDAESPVRDLEQGEKQVFNYTDKDGKRHETTIAPTGKGLEVVEHKEFTPANPQGGDTVVDLPKDAEEGSTAEIEYTDKDGKKHETTVQKTPEGWKEIEHKVDGVAQTDPNDPNISLDGDKATVANVQPGSDVAVITDNDPNVTITDDKITITNLQPESPVTSKIIDSQGNSSGEGKATTPPKDETPPAKPDVISNEDGTVDVVMPVNPEKGDKVTVTVTPKDSPVSIDVVFTFDPETGWTSNNPDLIPSVPKDGDKATIKAGVLEPGSPVIAVAEDLAGNKTESDQDQVKDIDFTGPEKPMVVANPDGTVTVTMPEKDVEVGDTVVVSVPELGKNEPTIVTLTKLPNGGWESSHPKLVPNVPENGNTTTIPAARLKDDGEKVSAYATDPANNRSGVSEDTVVKPTPTQSDVPRAASHPTKKGGIEVRPHANNTKMTVNYEDEEGNPRVTVTAIKDPDTDLWSLTGNIPEGVSIQADTGLIEIAPNSVKDGSIVRIQGVNGKNNPSSTLSVGTDEDTQSEPVIIGAGEESGSVKVSPGEGNTRFTVKYRNENDREQELSVAKDKETGEWGFVTLDPTDPLKWTPAEQPFGVTLNRQNGELEIAPDSILDNSDVFVDSQTTNDPIYEDKHYTAGEDERSPAPSVLEGSSSEMLVSPGPGNTTVDVQFTDRSGNTKTVKMAFNPENEQWEIVGTKPNGVLLLDPLDGILAISPAVLPREGAKVTATGQNGNNPISEEAVGAPTSAPRSAKPSIELGEMETDEQGGAEVTPGLFNTVMSLNYTDEKGDSHTLVVEQPAEGADWVIREGALQGEMKFDPTNGKVTFAPNDLLDGADIWAVGNTADLPPSEANLVQATLDKRSEQPTFELGDASKGTEVGSVIVKPGPKNTAYTVTYKDEKTDDNAQPVEHTVRAELVDGKWAIVGTIPAGVTIDDNGHITIAANNVLDKSEVEAIGYKGNDPKSLPATINAGDDEPALPPTIVYNQPETGAVIITPNPFNDKMKLVYRDEMDGEHTIIVAKDASGDWKPVEVDGMPTDTLPEELGIEIDAKNGAVTIPADSLKDLSPITGQGFTTGSPDSRTENWTAPKDAQSDQPTIEPIQTGEGKGGVVVKPHDNNTSLEISYKDEKTGEPKPFKAQKGEDDKWKLVDAPEGVMIDEGTGEVTIPAKNIASGENVVDAKGQNGNNDLSEMVSGNAVLGESDLPTIEPNPQEPGSVIVKPHADNETLKVTYTDENGKPVELVVRKQPSGELTLESYKEDGVAKDKPEGVKLDNGQVTIGADNIRSGEDVVTAVGTNPDSNPSAEVKGDSAEDARSPAPTPQAGENGVVTVTPGNGNTEMTVRYTNEADPTQEQTLVAKKVDGKWDIVEGKVDGITIDPNGIITFSADTLEDNTKVFAKGKNGDNPESEEKDATAGLDAKSPNPIVTPITEGDGKGSVEIEPNGNTTVTITYKDENNQPQTVIATKDPETGVWGLNPTAPQGTKIDQNGKVTLPANNVQDPSPTDETAGNVTAFGQKGKDPRSDDVTKKASEDPISLTPTIELGVEGSAQQGGATVKPVEGNTKLTITYFDESSTNGVSRTLVVEKNPISGNWTAPDNTANAVKEAINSGLITINRTTGDVTFAPDALKHGRNITAIGKSGNNPDSVQEVKQPSQDLPSEQVSIVEGTGTAKGSAIITPASGNDKMVITYLKEKALDINGRELPPETVTLTATKANNRWTLDKNETGVTIDAVNGTVTIAPNSLLDQDQLTAGQNSVSVVSTSGDNPSSAPKTFSANDAQSPAPTVTAGTKAGSIDVKPTDGNTKMIITLEQAPDVVIRADKTIPPEGGLGAIFGSIIPARWTVTVSNADKLTGGANAVQIDPVTGVVTIAANALEDGKKVFATAQNGNNPISTQSEGTAGADDALDPPTIEPQTSGNNKGVVLVKAPENPEANKYTVTFEDESGTDAVGTGKTQTVVVVKNGTTWAIQSTTDPKVTVANDGTLTIPAESVKDGSDVKAQASAPAANNSERLSAQVSDKAPEDPASPAPTVTALQGKTTSGEVDPNAAINGTVEVTPHATSTKMVVRYNNETEPTVEQMLEAEKVNNVWTITKGKVDGVEIHPNTGVITFSPETVNDGSLVYAKAYSGNNPASVENNARATQDKRSETPSVTIEGGAFIDGRQIGGTLKVVPKPSNTELIIEAQDETGERHRFGAKKENGVWKLNGAPQAGVTIDETSGEISFTADSLLDNSRVIATGIDGNNPPSNPTFGLAPYDPISPKPTFEHGVEGGAVVVRPGAGNDFVEVKYRNETNPEQEQTLQIAKRGDVWGVIGQKPAGIDLNAETGEITFNPDSVLDGSPMTAEGQNGTDEKSGVQPFEAGYDASHRPTLETNIPAGTLNGATAGWEKGGAIVTPHAENREVEITFKNEQNQDISVKLMKEGETWKQVPNADGITSNVGVLDPNSGRFTINPEMILDRSDVTVRGKDGEHNPSSSPVVRPVGEDAQSPKPIITPIRTGDMQGSVEISPVEGNTTVTVRYTPEGANARQAVITAVKGANNLWSIADKPADVNIDPNSGKITLTPNSVRDNSIVTATARNNTNPVSEAATDRAPLDPQSAKPTITYGEDGKFETQGAVKVAPGVGNTSLTVSYTPETGTQQRSVTATKDPVSGKWSIVNKPNNVEINEDTGEITLTPNSVRDDSSVTARGQNGNDPVSELSDGRAKPDFSPAPTFGKGTEQGSVTVTPDPSNTRLTVRYLDESGTSRQINTEKGQDDNWTITLGANLEGVSIDRDSGVVTIAANGIKDGITAASNELTAIARSGNNPLSATVSGTSDVDAKSSQPKIADGRVVGSVTIEPGEGNTKMTINYTDETGVTTSAPNATGGRPVTLTATKNAQGQWSLNNDAPEGVTIDRTSGVVTLAPNNVKDFTTVSARGENGNNPTSDVETGTAARDAQSPPPTVVKGAEKGSIVVTPHVNNTKEIVTFTDEAGVTRTVNLTKTGNTWSIDSLPNGATLNAQTGALTLPANLLQDRSTVTARGQNGNDPESISRSNTADEVEASIPPVVSAGTELGSMQVAPGAGNTHLTVTFTDEFRRPQTVEAERVNNRWQIKGNKPDGVEINANTGIISIAADAVLDSQSVGRNTSSSDSVVEAWGQSGTAPRSETVSGKPAADAKSRAPSITAGTEQGSVKVDAAESSNAVTVEYTNEAGVAQRVNLSKNAQTGKWAITPAGSIIADRTGLSLDEDNGILTIGADHITQTADITAFARDSQITAAGTSHNPLSDTARGRATVDVRSPAPQITKGTEQGSMVVTPATGNTKISTTFTDEGGTERKVTYQKNNAGQWTVVPSETTAQAGTYSLGANDGVLRLPANSVRDQSFVRSEASNGDNPVSVRRELQSDLDAKSPPPTIREGTEKGSVVVTPNVAGGNTLTNISFLDEGDRPRSVSISKGSDNKWQIVGTAPGVSINADTGALTIAADSVKDGSQVTAQSQNGNNPMSDVVPFTAPNDYIPKLVVRLNSDSGRSNTDKITNDGQIWVDNVQNGAAWEYSTDGGRTWNDGGIGGAGQEGFVLPSTSQVKGRNYQIVARVKGADDSRSDTLNMTLDQVAAPKILSVDGPNGGHTIYVQPETLRDRDSVALVFPAAAARNRDVAFQKNVRQSDGAIAMRGPQGTKISDFLVKETDIAGNIGYAKAPIIYEYNHLKGLPTSKYGKNWTGTDDNEILRIIPSASQGDGVIHNGDMDSGASVFMNGGDDELYMNSMWAATSVNMGSGNDTMNMDTIRGNVQINMGTGDDVLIIRGYFGARNYAIFGEQTHVNLGDGDDVLVLESASKIGSPSSDVIGGAGYDIIKSNQGLSYSTRLSSHRDMDSIQGFEEIDMRNTARDELLLSSRFLQRNHHNGVFTVKGNDGDKVDLENGSYLGKGQDGENISYNIYSTSSGTTVWLQDTIAVAVY